MNKVVSALSKAFGAAPSDTYLTRQLQYLKYHEAKERKKLLQKQRRRAANKRARQARKISRKAA